MGGRAQDNKQQERERLKLLSKEMKKDFDCHTDTALDSNIFQKDPNIIVLEIHLNSQEKVVTILFLFQTQEQLLILVILSTK